tara:strand:+ start:4060 stop:5355 length:1296 start_codon:yes stop_codon:yes gene_type:complete
MLNSNVYVGMSADILHSGHMNILREASKLGKVTVGLLTDHAISTYKKMPIMAFEDRKSVIAGIKYVSEVVPQETHDYTENLRKLKPSIVVHGDDWKTGIQKDIREKVIKVLQEWDGELIEIPYTEGVSSSIYKSKVKKNLTTDERRQSLVKAINNKDTLIFLDIHNALSGIVIENTRVVDSGVEYEFDGMWASSLTDSTAKGKPDIEAVDTTSRINTINEIIEVTSKPIIYDGDTGGKPEHFIYTVKNLERIGVSAVVIEDKVGLKKNSLFGDTANQKQDSIENFSEKIRAGNNAKRTNDFLIIARIESLILNQGMNDALSRADAYINAGAGGILIHSKSESEEEIFEFVKKYRDKHSAPIVVVPTTFNHVSLSEFKQIGVDVVIYANHLLRSAYPAMVNTAQSILKNGRTQEIEKNLMSIKDIINFTDIS